MSIVLCPGRCATPVAHLCPYYTNVPYLYVCATHSCDTFVAHQKIRHPLHTIGTFTCICSSNMFLILQQCHVECTYKVTAILDLSFNNINHYITYYLCIIEHQATKCVLVICHFGICAFYSYGALYIPGLITDNCNF